MCWCALGGGGCKVTRAGWGREGQPPAEGKGAQWGWAEGEGPGINWRPVEAWVLSGVVVAAVAQDANIYLCSTAE